MKKLFAVAALGVALSTAMPAIARPVQVTRFAIAEAIVPGPVAPMKTAVSLEQSTYDTAVVQELARIGFSGEGAARYDYTVEVTKDVRRDPVRRSPVTIGIGGGTGGWGGGFGIGGSFGVGTPRGRDTTVTRLFVQLRDRSTGKTVWEGRAESESGAAGGERIERLAAALFRDFPGQSGRTISVK
ncbi:DUF4136 domain-containing protein [Sphingomonas sp. SUN039]|uniref:DUF4136 domain-containing protein n=1 Tax=Sphingomonas sp. SUN039 TaxID=2937787 RepID=UPI00216435A4|nr:DUF4136 domain-containing protein [Sphingomonas sp. SUN039]UVO55531.1 DUF4136 domain-containing protein [Sphingomonas sp. SUN039]